MFELSDSEFKARTRWGVWAYYVQGQSPRTEEEEEKEEFIDPNKEYGPEELEGTRQKTRSSRRRQQRKAESRWWQENF